MCACVYVYIHAHIYTPMCVYTGVPDARPGRPDQCVRVYMCIFMHIYTPMEIVELLRARDERDCKLGAILRLNTRSSFLVSTDLVHANACLFMRGLQLYSMAVQNQKSALPWFRVAQPHQPLV